MAYYIDLKTISLDDYKNKLIHAHMLPSRIILKEQAEERFACFKNLGIKHLAELQQSLKNKKRFAELANQECFTEEYLTILLREINSIQPKPNKMEDFTGIAKKVINKLNDAGIKDTVSLFEKIKTQKARNDLAASFGISHELTLELAKLTDLSRIRWVGATFARVLYESGFDTVEKVALADYEQMHAAITKINKDKMLYRGQIGLNDMKLCVLAARDVPLEIEY
jgi:hypothetical protein